MPLNPSQIAAALNPNASNVDDDDDLDAPDAGEVYVPTDNDKRRAKERIAYAVQVAKAASVDLVTPSTIDGASVMALRTTLRTQIGRNKRNDLHKLAAVLLIDAHRILMGASDATPVPDLA